MALPDELAYSIVARAALLNGLTDTRHAMLHLVGNRDAMVSIDLPNRLPAIFSHLGPIAGIRDAVDLLEEHTLFPYYRAFMPGQRWSEVLRSALGDQPAPVKALMGLLAHGIGASSQLRCCARCDEESRAAHGTAYWHREHHLPGISTCLTHGEPLVRLAYQDQIGHRARLLLPPPLPYPQLLRKDLLGPAMRLAQVSRAALRSQQSLPAAELRRSAILGELARRGWVGRRGAPAFDRLSTEMTSTFSGLELLQPGSRLAPHPNGRMPWLESLFHKRDQFRPPVCHLLLIALLFENWTGFLVACEDAADTSAVRIRAQPIRPLIDRSRSLDLHAAVFDSSISCRRAADHTGLSVQTIVCRRRAAGMPVSTRSHLRTREHVEDVIRWLAEGIAVAEVSRRSALSLNTIYRLLTSSPDLRAIRAGALREQRRREHRHSWMKLMEEHPGDGVKLLRQRAEATYAWLYRHDREWLHACRPAAKRCQPRARVDWETRDVLLAKRVENALQCGAHALSRLDTTAGLVGHVYQATPARKHAARLPRFWIAINRGET